jgi:hypothetical protein
MMGERHKRAPIFVPLLAFLVFRCLSDRYVWSALVGLGVFTMLAQHLLALGCATAPTDKIITWATSRSSSPQSSATRLARGNHAAHRRRRDPCDRRRALDHARPRARAGRPPGGVNEARGTLVFLHRAGQTPYTDRVMMKASARATEAATLDAAFSHGSATRLSV